MHPKLTFAPVARLPHLPRCARPAARPLAIGALLLGAVGFGLGTVATKGAMDGFPPLTLAAARFAVAAVVLLAVCRGRGLAPVFDARAALLGATGTAVPYALQNLGLERVAAGNATLLIEGGLPMMTAALGVAFLRERVGGSRAVGLALGVGGVAAVSVGELGGAMPLSGAALCLAAGAALAAYTVLGRRLFRDGFDLGVLTGGTVLGALMLGPFATAEVATGGLPTPGMADVALVLLLGVGCSALTNLLWTHGLTVLDAAEVGIFGTIMPIFGIAAAALFLGEAISLPQLAGAALIVAGMAVTARPGPIRRPRIVRSAARPAPANLVAVGLVLVVSSVSLLVGIPALARLV